MQLSWEREDIVSSDDEFAEMASTVAQFVYYANGTFGPKSYEKVAAVRSKEAGKIGTILDSLSQAIKEDDYNDADVLLDEAIDEKRRIRGLRKPSSD